MNLKKFFFLFSNFEIILLSFLIFKTNQLNASKEFYNFILPKLNPLNQSVSFPFLLNNNKLKETAIPKIFDSIIPITKFLPILSKIKVDKNESTVVTKKEETKLNHLNLNKNYSNYVFVRRSRPTIESFKFNYQKNLNSPSKHKFKRPTIKINNLNSVNPFDIKEFNSKKNLEEECNQIVELSSLPIRISSPNFSKGSYLPDSYCIYNLTTSESPYIQKIKLKIIKLDLEYSRNCERDYLTIINSDIRFCGEMIDKTFTLNQSNAQLLFKSDLTNQLKGFRIEVLAQPSNCETTIKLKNIKGEITSPNYPLNYPDSFECWTLLDGSNLQTTYNLQNPLYNENFSIIFTFETIDMEADPTCSIDYVELYEIDYNSMLPKNILGRFCEYNRFIRQDFSKEPTSSDNFQVNGNQVRSRLPYLYIHFKSDKVLNSRGFKAHFKLELPNLKKMKSCSWKPNIYKKVIFSPNFPRPYPPNIDCSIELGTTNQSQKIEIIFDKFVIEPHSNCTFDKLMIYDFDKINVKSKRSPIGFFGGKLIDFTSVIPIDYTATESYSEINEETERNFQFYSENKPTHVFCGKKENNFRYISKSNKITLRFITDDFGEYPGFVLHYKFIDSSMVNKLKEDKIKNEEIEEKKIEFDLMPQSDEVKLGSSHILQCKPKDYQKETSNLNKLLDNIKNKSKNSNNFFSQLARNQTTTKTLRWYKDDLKITNDISDDGTILLIREFSLTSKGHYKCKFGSSSREATLKIKSSDCSILFQKRPSDHTVTEGESAILECNAVATKKTKIEISWKHNNKTIESNENIKVLSNNYLLINDLKPDNAGYYYCVVKSRNQDDCTGQAIAQLTVRSRTDVDKICGNPISFKNESSNTLISEHGKIVGGNQAFRGQYPWQVMFWDAQRNSFCGGAILNERWVITAAHCFKPNSNAAPPPLISQIVVRLGKHDQKEIEEKEIITQIADYYLHPQYNPGTFDNDLALIQVKDHIKFNQFVQPICLSNSKSSKEFFDDKKPQHNNKIKKFGHVTGWGQTRENGLQPRYLQQMKVPLVERSKCEQSTTFKVTENMFCAGYGQELIGDACKGDSGSPFVALFNDGRWHLVGIVSWGEGCGRAGKYGFYTKVSNYIEWIKAFIQI